MTTNAQTMDSVERISKMLEQAEQWLPLCKARRLQGDMLREAGDLPRARAMYDRAMMAYRRADAQEDALEEAYLLDRFSALALDTGRYDDARTTIGRALEIREALLGEEHEETRLTRYLFKVAQQQYEMCKPGSNVVPFRRRDA